MVLMDAQVAWPLVAWAIPTRVCFVSHPRRVRLALLHYTMLPQAHLALHTCQLHRSSARVKPPSYSVADYQALHRTWGLCGGWKTNGCHTFLNKHLRKIGETRKYSVLDCFPRHTCEHVSHPRVAEQTVAKNNETSELCVLLLETGVKTDVCC